MACRWREDLTSTNRAGEKDEFLARVQRAHFSSFGPDCRQHGMYGPPPCRKRKVKMDGLVCANVSGLFVSRGSGP
jgi:hypothetical protein